MGKTHTWSDLVLSGPKTLSISNERVIFLLQHSHLLRICWWVLVLNKKVGNNRKCHVGRAKANGKFIAIRRILLLLCGGLLLGASGWANCAVELSG